MTTSLPEAPRGRGVVKRAVLFFLITFGVSWALWLPFVLRVFDQRDQGIFLVLGAAAPSTTAFVLTAVYAGRKGVRGLLRQAARWRVGAGWYAVVLAAPGLAAGVGVAVAAALGDQPPAVSPWVPAVVSGLIVGVLEEFGWMGFAFPALQARYGFVWAGVAVGAAVALWHLPFLFILGLPQYGASPLILIERIPVTLLFGWIYNGTGRSLLLMILFHASLNTWTETLSLPPGSTEPAALSLTAIIWVAAAVVVLMNLRARRAAR
jgi:uncharacterized protein